MRRSQGESPSRLIDARIEALGDWRGERLGRLHGLIGEADPDIVEEWKWRGVPVWSHDRIVCTGETDRTRRAIGFREGETADEAALAALVRATVSLNGTKSRKR